MKKEKELRTDVLTGELAAVFAKMHCDVDDPMPFLIDGDKNSCGLLRSADGEKYYLVKVVANWGYLQDDPTYRVDMIRTEPVDLVKAPRNASIRKQQHGLDLDLIVDGKPTTVYFNPDLYPFDSFETREAFEHFANEVFEKDSKFKTLPLIANYFADENFVKMAKERVRHNIQDVMYAGSLKKMMLLRNVNKVIEQYAKQGTMGD